MEHSTLNRCDHGDCNAQAYVLIRFPENTELCFCSHHYNEHETRLGNHLCTIEDHRELLHST